MLVHKFLSKRMLLIIMAYFMVIVIFSIYSATKVLNNSLFDYVLNLRGGGSADSFTLSIGALPILALMLPLIMDRFENEMIVLE